ncbi:MAG: hypothetical protein ACFFD1_13335, partial [Candidatus Thorarchaeota archaeon]
MSLPEESLFQEKIMLQQKLQMILDKKSQNINYFEIINDIKNIFLYNYSKYGFSAVEILLEVLDSFLLNEREELVTILIEKASDFNQIEGFITFIEKKYSSQSLTKQEEEMTLRSMDQIEEESKELLSKEKDIESSKQGNGSLPSGSSTLFESENQASPQYETTSSKLDEAEEFTESDIDDEAFDYYETESIKKARREETKSVKAPPPATTPPPVPVPAPAPPAPKPTPEPEPVTAEESSSKSKSIQKEQTQETITSSVSRSSQEPVPESAPVAKPPPAPISTPSATPSMSIKEKESAGRARTMVMEGRDTSKKSMKPEKVSKKMAKAPIKSEEFGGLLGEQTTIDSKKDSQKEMTVFQTQRFLLIDYFRQMNPYNVYSFSITFSKKELQVKKRISDVLTGESREQVSETFELKSESPLVIEAQFPGCLVTPAVHRISVYEDKKTVTFFVTPIANGTMKGSILVSQDNETIFVPLKRRAVEIEGPVRRPG